MPSIHALPARSRPRLRLCARNTVAVRRFGSCARSELLLSELQQWATANGLPPQVDPSAFLRLGLELLRIEAARAASDDEHRLLARRVEKAAAGAWVKPRETRSDPDNHEHSLPPVPLVGGSGMTREEMDALHDRIDALTALALAERRPRRRKTTT